MDPPQLDLLLKQLRLPTMRTLWRSFTERADREGWPAARLLAALASQEVTDRERRRFERHRAEAKLPPGKTLDNFDFTLVPAVSKARVGVLASGDTWLDEGANVLGPPGTGKSHLAAGLGLRLVENGFRVLYQRTANLVQKLQAARRDLALEGAVRKLYKYHLLILDDFSYVTSEHAETSVLFELVGARYENRSLLVIANEPFSAWGRIFGGDAMTLAAVDRLVHRSHIFELNVESYRRRAAIAGGRDASGRTGIGLTRPRERFDVGTIRDRGSERRPEPSKGASRNLRSPLNRPSRGETTRFRAIPVANGPRIRPQRPPNRLHPTPIPRRIRLPPPRPGSLRSPRRGGGRPPESALQADACPPSRSPFAPLPRNRHRPRTRSVATPRSHLDCRNVLILIVAGQRCRRAMAVAREPVRGSAGWWGVTEMYALYPDHFLAKCITRYSP